MAWVVFNVTINSSNSQADGQCQFTRTITNGVLKTGAQLQYSPSAASSPPNPTTIFTTQSDINLNSSSVYPLPDVTLPNKFNIPPKGTFTGGNYNKLTNATFDPSTNTISGMFSVVKDPTGDDDDCNWTAQAGS